MIDFLRRYVFHNAGLKLIALGAAILLWVAVARDPVAEVAVTVPIEFHHVPSGIEISTEQIPEAQIRVRGPGRVVRSLEQGRVHAVIDLSAAKPGERTYELGGSQISVPRGVDVVQVVPAQLRLTFDRRGSKEVPIRPRVIGLLPGKSRPEIQVHPTDAVIVGPEKRVQSIEYAYTDAVDAEGVLGRSPFTGIHVYVTDPLVRVAQPQAVTVTINTSSEPAAKPARTQPGASRR